ncbi:MAG: response regulator [Deltaproteobacteria bacterium]|nr:response regulator [Deltaproteobacteria bacterium]MDZ4342678.1 response regulator [Candidatus Binatia bacterium]
MAAKIMIVDDNADCRELLAILLGSLGHEIVQAKSGEESLEKAVLEKPDLIIMDMLLPGISGLGTTAKLKQGVETAAIPIVAFSGWAERQFQDRAKQAGIVAFVTKPTSARALHDVIKQFVRSYVDTTAGADLRER